jgi:hypothetical protein
MLGLHRTVQSATTSMAHCNTHMHTNNIANAPTTTHIVFKVANKL